ncbi:MAG: hypothetical protein ACRDLB_00645 [Actinomycetota bacterium]
MTLELCIVYRGITRPIGPPPPNTGRMWCDTITHDKERRTVEDNYTGTLFCIPGWWQTETHGWWGAMFNEEQAFSAPVYYSCL